MRRRRLLGVALSLVALGACSSGSSTGTTTTRAAAVTTTTTAAATTTAVTKLTILVSNDDGVHAPGIDALVQALVKLPNVDVFVSAPAENQSGSGGKTTAGALTASSTTTISGHPATAVDGFPADAVDYALDNHLVTPDLVVTGSNMGQNLGPFIDASGTIGAARAGAQHGIPALAVSQGPLAAVDFTASVAAAIAWITAHRDDLAGATKGGVVNINAPTCPSDVTRGVVEVPSGTDLAGRAYDKTDCASTATNPRDDVDAYAEGYVAESMVPAAPAG